MKNDLERRWRDLLLGHTKGPLASVSKAFLRLCSWPYRAVVAARNRAFDQGLLTSHKVPNALVISVGNIVAGGTGKTPFTLLLAQELSDLSLAILSRGYHSPSETYEDSTVLSRGFGPEYGSEICGDEPFLLASRLPQVSVIVGQNRLRSAEIATQAGANVLILDDGMQHRRVKRDVEIVILDADDPFGLGYHLPRGFLRESSHALERADLIVVNHVSDNFSQVCEKIKNYTNAPIIGTQVVVLGNPVQGCKVGLFCGIANPERFRQTVQSLGASVVEEWLLPDHASVNQTELHVFVETCRQKGVDCLVCTEKDHVKLSRDLKPSLPIHCIKIGLEIVCNQETWITFLRDVRSAASSKKAPNNK